MFFSREPFFAKAVRGRPPVLVGAVHAAELCDEVPRKIAKELVLRGKKRRAAQGSKDLEVADNVFLVVYATAAFDVGPIIVDAQGVNAGEEVQKVPNDA